MTDGRGYGGSGWRASGAGVVMRELDTVRAISLRRASKQERTLYAENNR